MLDIQYIRENSALVKEAVKNKKVTVDIDELLKVDESRRNLLCDIEKLRT
ncbi:MAG: serine--tRNA ligase, partial [Candidatus Moranbacteria bacterium]|nr:serine--tRNA ligase [Candidatus Moranbacteria bacterium]